ncbi:phosphotransferase [Planctomycetaceae bacterium SH139]
MIWTEMQLVGVNHPAWLAECLDTQAATSALSRALCCSAGPWRSLEVVEASLHRLKPGKRCLVSYDCRVSTGEVVRVLGKVRFKGSDKSLRPLTNHLRNHGIGDLGRVTETTAVVPRVWGEIAGWNMVLIEYLAGELAEPDADTLARDHACVADAICDLHRVCLPIAKDHTVDTELAILSKIYGQFADDHPQWSNRCHGIWHRMQRYASQVSSRHTCLIHRDFYFDQILLLPTGKVALLDLDLACLGPPGLDAGNYLAHLRELSIRRPTLQHVCQMAELAFAERFLQHSTEVSCRELRFWTLVSLARLAALSVRFPDRVQTTENLFDVVETGLHAVDGC